VEKAQKTLAELQQTVKDGQNARMLQRTLTPLKNIDLTELKKKEEEVKLFKQKYEALVKLREALAESQKKIQLTEQQIIQLQNLPNLEAQYKALQHLSEQLKTQTEKTQKAKVLYQEMQVILQEGKAKRKIVDALTVAVSNVQTVEYLKKQQEAIAKGKVILQDVKQIQTQSQKISKTIQEQNNTLISQKQQYCKKLTETNSCPICHTPINQDTIEKIVKDL
jgi:hypothetical protein